MWIGAASYRAYCDATGKTGTEFVKQAATFFGPDKHYLELWEIPDAKPETESLMDRVHRKNGTGQSREVLVDDGGSLRPSVDIN